MDFRLIFGIFLIVLAVQAAPPTDNISVVPRENLLLRPLILTLNEEDREALSLATQQVTQQNKANPRKLILTLNDEDKEALLLATQHVTQRNKANPGEETHGILEGLLNSAETVANILTKLMNNVQTHEEKSHSAIEDLRSSAPDITDVCVQDVFGTSTRDSSIYCGVKYLSQVAIGLYDMKQTVGPLRQNFSKLSSDLTKCSKIPELSTKLLCDAQAWRDGWQESEYARTRLGQHLTLIRFLAIEISDCINRNHGIQEHLVNKVAECARANK